MSWIYTHARRTSCWKTRWELTLPKGRLYQTSRHCRSYGETALFRQRQIPAQCDFNGNSSTTLYHAHTVRRNQRASPTTTTFNSRSRPHFSTNSVKGMGTAAVASSISEELRDLVVHYPSPDAEITLRPKVAHTTRTRKAVIERRPPRPLEGYQNLSPAAHRVIKIINSSQTVPSEIFNAYQQLPEPRPAQLPRKYLHKILTALSTVESKDATTSLRFFSVVDDLKAHNIPLTSKHWTSAIAFAGRCVKMIGDTEIETVLATWTEMESEAGIKPDATTFNVLFDIAVKAEKFVLAEMLLREMRARSLPSDRFSRTALFAYYGRKGDGDGIRQAYREMVEAAEIVDTTILNAVISAFITAGEPAMAEITFERMKRLDAQLSGKVAAPRSWRGRKFLGQKLRFKGESRTSQCEFDAPRDSDNDQSERTDNKSDTLSTPPLANANASKHNTGAQVARVTKRQRLQDQVAIGPSLQTYKILIRHHCLTSGDWFRTHRLVKELSSPDVDLPIAGAIYFNLFRGFAIHGQKYYSEWTIYRLDMLFKSFMEAVAATQKTKEQEEKTERVSLGIIMVKTILEAYAKCSDEHRIIAVWQHLLQYWKCSEDEVIEAMSWLKECSGRLGKEPISSISQSLGL